jgi:hypothetical protein
MFNLLSDRPAHWCQTHTVRSRHRGLWQLAAGATITIAATTVLTAVWLSSHRGDLATYGAFAVAVVALISGPINWAWRAMVRPPEQTAKGKELDQVADSLARAVKEQWERAALERGLISPAPIPVSWGRPSMPIAGPVVAATSAGRFDPLPGLASLGERRMVEGQIEDLHDVYGGLRSGRLVIVGAPGSGKSSAAVLLVLTALRYRDGVSSDGRPKVPVPVLFTVQDWDPVDQLLKDWLVVRMQESYPLFTGREGAANARGLVASGKITLILDGLDEIAEELRPIAIEALSRQSNFRVVVLSRTAEMATAVSRQGVLPGAVAIELRHVDPLTAANYLRGVRPDPLPPAWRDLIGLINTTPANPLVQALDNPLTLTLLRDTCQAEDDARQLLDFCDAIQQHGRSSQGAEEITDYLLDQVVESAYTRQPGQPASRYDPQTAGYALAKIAARMNQDGTRDMQWWRLTEWASPVPSITAIGIVSGLLSGLVSWLLFGLIAGLVIGSMDAFIFALFGLAAWKGTISPGRLGRAGLIKALGWTHFLVGIICWLVTGFVATAIVTFAVGMAGLGGASFGGFPDGLRQGLGFVLWFGGFGLVCAALLAWFNGFLGNPFGGLFDLFSDLDGAYSPRPVISWRDDRYLALSLGFAFASVCGLWCGLVLGLGSLAGGPVYALGSGLGGGLTVGLETGIIIGLAGSKALVSSLAARQLSRRWHIPGRLVEFLDDACKRNVLRTVGPVYQFRHARLQDRLTAANLHSNQSITNGRSS